MFYCTSAKLTISSWFCSKEHISSVSMPVKNYGRGKLLGIQLLCFHKLRILHKLFREVRLRRLLMFLGIIFMLFA